MKLFIFVAMSAFALHTSMLAAENSPVNIVLDTDIGGDIEDALALAQLHALLGRHEANVLAVTISNDNKWAAPYVDLVNTFYGHPEIPIGMVRNGKTENTYPWIQNPSVP